MNKDEWYKCGRDRKGNQRWKNKITGKVVNEVKVRPTIEQKYYAVKAYLLGMTFQACALLVGVSKVSVYNWFVKFGEIVKRTDFINADVNVVYEDVEIDEMWHFCKKKVKRRGYS
jgi:transposase-like protein